MTRLTVLGIFILLSTGIFACPREKISIDDNWQFAFGDASSPEKDFGCGTEYFNYLTKAASIHNEGPYAAGFDASGWEVVDLPHDWVVDLPYAPEASHSHGYKTVGYRYPETSVGWYRKTFYLPAEDFGKHIWLQFDGIFRDARIWVNGFYVGHEPSGYASQTYDISEYLNYGGENLICVRADATIEEGWFYEGAGIYRHVWLNKAAPLHVAPYGTFVHCEFPTPYSLRPETLPDLSTASVHIETTVRNMGTAQASYTLKHTLLDASGKPAGTCETAEATVAAKTEHITSGTIPVENPHLWSCDDPYLYTVRTDVYSDGILTDSYTTATGIRHIAFDPDKGFMLNNIPVKLKGVNMHQDHAGVGAAIPDALQEWRLIRLKMFGCNAYRSSHNPMTPEMLDACDRLGILVIEENRLTGINREHIDLLKRMIVRDRNHPSVILWSVGNEEWGIEWNGFGTRIVETMREYCHLYDPTRLMTVASSGGPTPLIPADVAGYNYLLQNPIDQHRSDYPQRCALGSEETTGCGTRGVYFDSSDSSSGISSGNGRMVSHNRKPHEKDSLYNQIERGWKFYSERPWLAGLFYWTGFDYRGEPNPMVFPATNSQFGITDYCGFQKDEAYYLKSWWTSEPVLHILPHWNLDGHEGEKVSVWVYSNCDQVRLTVNGQKLAKKTMPANGHLEWEAIYEPGYVKATGYKDGKKVMETKVETTGETACHEISYDFIGKDGKWVFGAESLEEAAAPETVITTVRSLDAKGRFVPTACEDLEFSAPEGYIILGWGNGDPAFRHIERPGAADDKGSMTIRTFNGYAQVILKASQFTTISSRNRNPRIVLR